MPNSPRIQRLDSRVADKIAAGEVILNPASVVKELVENALDAGATDIGVDVHAGGLQAIEVRDNGSGIHYDDLPLAVERHATSKIAATGDLEKIRTLGFRGEALPSIAAVSRLTLESAVATSEHGGRIELQAGRIIEHTAAGVPSGSCVRVEDLFYSLPARRKFLKSPTYEFQRIHRWLKRMALALPQVTLRIAHNGRQQSFYPATSSQQQRLFAVLGSLWKGKTEELWEERHGASIHIFFTRPEISFATTAQQVCFLNGRMISDRTIKHALSEAYRTLTMERRHPGVVLFLEMDPAQFDVNVHPSKEEVRFKETQTLYKWIFHLLRNHLVGSKVVLPLHSLEKTDVAPPSSYRPMRVAEAVPWTNQSSTQELNSRADQQRMSFVAGTTVREGALRFSALQPIGQYHASYILCEANDALVLIDQHAAHERVLFERLRKQLFDDKLERQVLLQPLTVQLETQDEQTLKQYAELIDNCGFDVEPFGGQSYLIRTVPAYAKIDGVQLLQEVLKELAEQGSSSTLEHMQDRLLQTMACHSAVRFHDSLSLAEIKLLLKELDETDNATNCPHGRPTFLIFRDSALKRMFHRI